MIFVGDTTSASIGHLTNAVTPASSSTTGNSSTTRYITSAGSTGSTVETGNSQNMVTMTTESPAVTTRTNPSNLTTGTVIGIVVGAVLGVALCAAVAGFIYKKKESLCTASIDEEGGKNRGNTLDKDTPVLETDTQEIEAKVARDEPVGRSESSSKPKKEKRIRAKKTLGKLRNVTKDRVHPNS